MSGERRGDAVHEIKGRTLHVSTNYSSGNIAVNASILLDAQAQGVEAIEARNNTSDFEFCGTVDEFLANAEHREGRRDGDFYLLRKTG